MLHGWVKHFKVLHEAKKMIFVESATWENKKNDIFKVLHGAKEWYYLRVVHGIEKDMIFFEDIRPWVYVPCKRIQDP